MASHFFVASRLNRLERQLAKAMPARPDARLIVLHAPPEYCVEGGATDDAWVSAGIDAELARDGVQREQTRPPVLVVISRFQTEQSRQAKSQVDRLNGPHVSMVKV